MARDVFTKQRADDFHRELAELLDRYPEHRNGLKACYTEQDALDDIDASLIEHYGRFDPESPVYTVGYALLVSIRNMQGYETMFTTSPPNQSSYFTDGLVANRAGMI